MKQALFTVILALIAISAVGQQNANQAAASPAIGAAATTTSQPGTNTQRDSSPDPLLDVPPLPKTTVTLVGGTVSNIDRVRNHLTVEPFGGKKMKLAFDERTHIFRDGVETTQLGIQKGDRVYVDTQLDGTQVFARNIRVESKSGPADARGQILSFDSGHGTVTIRDDLSTQPVTFKIDSSTSVRGKGQSTGDLAPGSLVLVRFASGSGKSGLAQEINIVARPGQAVTFAGKVVHLDLSSGLLAVLNQSDNKTYDIRFDPGQVNTQHLALGSDVAITTEFDGSSYNARSITLNQARAQ